MKSRTCSLLNSIKKNNPLVHNITNFVVMNSSANILLALGASPVMAHAAEEAAEMTNLADALVLNIGTLEDDWINAMITAGQFANEKDIPIVLDPVGAGATQFRTDSALRIMDEVRISVLRGNASEILALSGVDGKTKGVDSSLSMSDYIVDAASQLALKRDMVVAVSGAEDCICNGTITYRIRNGHPLMTRVTGTGCGLSAVTAAFLAVSDNDYAKAAASAFGFYGVCGELAVELSDKPGSFSMAFLDCLYSAGDREICERLIIES